MSITAVYNQLSKYLGRNFKDCKFSLEKSIQPTAMSTLRIMLIEGPFEALSQGSGLCFVRATKHTFYGAVGDLDPRYVSAMDGRVLSEESTKVFQEIVRYIKDKIPHTNIEFSFAISAVYRVVYKEGDIAKPTDIDHKTFKGRKRRSVAEAILDIFE